MADAPRKPPQKPVKRPLSKAALAAIKKRPRPSDLARIERLRKSGVII